MSGNRCFIYSKNNICSKWKFMLFNSFLTYSLVLSRAFCSALRFCFLWDSTASITSTTPFLHRYSQWAQLYMSLHPWCPAGRAAWCWQLLISCRNPGLLSRGECKLISSFPISKILRVLGDEGTVCVNVKDNSSGVSGKWRWWKYHDRTTPWWRCGWRGHFCPRLSVLQDCAHLIECLFRRTRGKRLQHYWILFYYRIITEFSV